MTKYITLLDRNTNLSNQYIIESSKLTGAITAAMVSGPDDGNSVFAGSQIGRNAAENNYLMPQEKAKLVRELGACNGDQGCKDQVQARYEAISKPRDKNFDKFYADCEKGNCTEFNKIHYDLRMKLTEEGNDYYNSLTPEQRAKEFKLLPAEASIFHTYQQDSSGNIINVRTGAEQGYAKYIHPVYGYEIVLDANKNIVTNPLNAGTYNFYNPNLGMNNTLLEDRFGGLIGGVLGNHKIYDVDPYLDFGNAPYPTDPTTSGQRLRRFLYKPKN